MRTQGSSPCHPLCDRVPVTFGTNSISFLNALSIKLAGESVRQDQATPTIKCTGGRHWFVQPALPYCVIIYKVLMPFTLCAVLPVHLYPAGNLHWAVNSEGTASGVDVLIEGLNPTATASATT